MFFLNTWRSGIFLGIVIPALGLLDAFDHPRHLCPGETRSGCLGRRNWRAPTPIAIRCRRARQNTVPCTRAHCCCDNTKHPAAGDSTLYSVADPLISDRIICHAATNSLDYGGDDLQLFFVAAHGHMGRDDVCSAAGDNPAADNPAAAGPQIRLHLDRLATRSHR